MAVLLEEITTRWRANGFTLGPPEAISVRDKTLAPIQEVFVKQGSWVFLWVLISLAVSPVPALAHHGNAAYDPDSTISLKATITDFEFANPHVQISFDTKDDKGNLRHWSCEGTNPAMLVRAGWSRDTLKPGDQVTIFVHPNRDPAITVVSFVKVVLANGQVVDSHRE